MKCREVLQVADGRPESIRPPRFPFFFFPPPLTGCRDVEENEMKSSRPASGGPKR